MFVLVLDVATRVSNISASTHLFVLRLAFSLLRIHTRLTTRSRYSHDVARNLAQSTLTAHL